jgi:hypothetical protein
MEEKFNQNRHETIFLSLLDEIKYLFCSDAIKLMLDTMQYFITTYCSKEKWQFTFYSIDFHV